MGKFVTKPSLLGTLRNLEVGDDPIEIKTKEFKTTFVRSSVSKINKEGKNQLSCTEVGVIDGIKVWRIK